MKSERREDAGNALRYAAGLIRKGFVRGPYAVDEVGETIDPTDERAAAFCCYGAVMRASDCCGRGGVSYWALADYVRRALKERGLHGIGIAAFSEEFSKDGEDVACLLDEAAELAEGDA